MKDKTYRCTYCGCKVVPYDTEICPKCNLQPIPPFKEKPLKLHNVIGGLEKKEGLLPCPFCGGKARLWERKCDKTKYTIGCDNLECFAWIPKDVKLRELHNYATCYVKKQDAIDAWNNQLCNREVEVDEGELSSIVRIWSETFLPESLSKTISKAISQGKVIKVVK